MNFECRWRRQSNLKGELVVASQCKEGFVARSTFLMLGQAEEDIPSRDEDHVIVKILLLYLGLLHNNNVCFKDIEHSLRKGE